MKLLKQIEILRKASFTGFLTDEQLANLAESGRTINLKADQSLFEEGQKGNVMYFILTGELAVIKGDKIIAKRKSPEFFGEMALFESKPRAASVKALKKTLLLEIGKKAFQKYFENNSKIMFEFLKVISNRSRKDLDALALSFEEAKKQGEQNHRIITNVSDIIIQINPGGKIIFANPSVCACGYEPENLLGKHIRTLIDLEPDDPLWLSIMTLGIYDRQTRSLEVKLKTGGLENRVPSVFLLNASGVWSVSSRKVRDQNIKKTFAGTLCVLRDISERVRSEKWLKEYAGRLETTNKELEQFAYVTSHDLREPLRKIKYYGKKLGEKKGSREEKVHADKIISTTERMEALIESLYTLSKVSTKEGCLEIVDLNEILREATEDLENLIFRTKGKVQFRSLPVLKADPVQMRQLFQNLISNGLKFHRKNIPPRIKIRGAARKKTGKVEIQVIDNGIGLEEKYFEFIFKPFERVSRSNTFEGTGIGLAICEKIVARHNGTIAVKSVPGAGTTFVIHLPFAID